MLLENKTAVVYAAGGAIGGAAARAFAREGAQVFVTGRDLARVDAVAKEIRDNGGLAESAEVDALEPDAVEEHLDAVVRRTGGLDISFNAIGPGPAPERTAFVDLTVEEYLRPVTFYARTNFVTATAAARRMSARGSGVVVTLTALPGRLPVARIGASASGWAAVEAFSRSLALEVGPSGVRVVCLRANAIPETPVIKANFATAGPAAGMTPAEFQGRLEQGTLLRRLPTLDEVADTAAFVASDGAGAITGTVVNLSAGAYTD
jgi:NAD(P)-dependent dehydrogenase (short-subunit alcohol dehydrogenase family)